VPVSKMAYFIFVIEIIHRSIINYMIVYDKVLYYKLLVKQLIQIGKKDKWMVWIENRVVPVV
jgi:hypothetical protein